ncbi:sugar 3,4-ketoisomerase [Pseudomonas sp. nanlin1]|uniref:sugar 3,4-ketoisomerase n=1 Tax=Pseudomonas sp. nanlin1 TaxID=3040605 RepID=UPI00388EBDD7
MNIEQWVEFQILGDQRGSMVSIEQGRVVPFDIKRVYYIYHTEPGVSRGYHAHKALQQVMICVAGSCRVVLDDANTRQDVWLDSPTRGILVNGSTWREMHDFSDNCVLLVLASDHYDESDYIRNYDEFLTRYAR